jgi:hypothetical protein
VRTSASNTARAIAPAETARGEARVILPRLNPDPLTLPAHRFPEIVQLVFHDIVDRIASGIDVVAHLLDDIVDRQTVDQILSTLDRGSEPALGTRRGPPCALDGPASSPASAFESAPSGPSRSLEASQPRQRGTPACIPHEGADWTATRWPTAQQQGYSRANRSTDQCRRQQVVLLLTLFVQIRFWV